MKGTNNSVYRALILQGGGALAAYEVGVYAALYFWIKDLGKKEIEDSNIFDIIAGTSGGAINAALIVSHVMKNIHGNDDLRLEDCWVGSIKRLLDIYNHVSSDRVHKVGTTFNTWRHLIIILNSVSTLLLLYMELATI